MSCQISMKLDSSPQPFKKYSSIRLNENPSSGSRGVTCGWTDMIKLTVTYCNFVNMPKKQYNLNNASY